MLDHDLFFWEVSLMDEAVNALTGNAFLHNIHACYINADESWSLLLTTIIC